MRGTIRLPGAAYRLVDGTLVVLAVLLIVHAGVVLLGSAPTPAWPYTPGGPLPAWCISVLGVLFAIPVIFFRRRMAGGTALARGMGVLFAGACLADALGWFRLAAAGSDVPRGPVPMSLLLALLVLLWTRVRRARGHQRGEQVLWSKMLDQAIS